MKWVIREKQEERESCVGMLADRVGRELRKEQLRIERDALQRRKERRILAERSARLQTATPILPLASDPMT